jgi:hypothetical protein
MAKSNWTTIEHIGPKNPVASKSIKRKNRTFIPIIEPETRPEALRLIQERIALLNEAQRRKFHQERAARQQKIHICIGHSCIQCGFDEFKPWPEAEQAAQLEEIVS